MTVEAASNFLIGSILYSLGYLVILAGVIFANNIISKYWKSFGWSFSSFSKYLTSQNMRFMTDEEYKAHLEHQRSLEQPAQPTIAKKRTSK